MVALQFGREFKNQHSEREISGLNPEEPLILGCPTLTYDSRKILRWPQQADRWRRIRTRNPTDHSAQWGDMPCKVSTLEVGKAIRYVVLDGAA